MATIALELFAFVTYAGFVRERLSVHWRPDPVAALAAVTAEHLEQFRSQFFDAELGWVFKPETTAIAYTTFAPDGSRRDPLAGSALRSPRIVAYGDSFTFGEDVGDGETWPHLLAARLGEPVANFGVAGYGPDQAVLRLRRYLEQGNHPEVVILGVLSENIARVVNRWRYLYTGGEILNFKPRLAVDADGVRWIPNPLASLDVASLQAAAAAAPAGDYWAAYNDARPRPGFPYLWAEVTAAWYLSHNVRRWQDLWSEHEPRATMDALVGAFVAMSVTFGFTPVLVMVPMPEDLRRSVAGMEPHYAAFVADVNRHVGGRLLVADVLAQPFERERFNLQPFAGHASARGNEAIAAAVAESFGRR